MLEKVLRERGYAESCSSSTLLASQGSKFCQIGFSRNAEELLQSPIINVQYHTTEMIHSLGPNHEMLSEGLTKSATVRNHEYCHKTETIHSRKQNRNKWIKAYAMQATENGDFQNRK